MERGSAKHGPLHDDELAHETEPMVRGAPQRAHEEEWRETEPVEDAMPPVRRPDAGPRPEGRDVELRSELARVVSRDLFPADRDELLGRVTDSDAPRDLADRIAGLPAGRRYGNVHDVLVALGMSSPETR